MSELESNYQKFTNEELLKRRALGEDGLSEEAHKVIEKILNERGVKYQAIPKNSVESSSVKESKKSKTGLMVAIVLGFVLIQTFAGNQYKHLISFSYIAVIALFLLVKKVASKKDESQVGNDGFTELMKCSVEGNLKRVEELLNYSDELNAVDGKGTTALMYAIANKHNDIARLLIMRGADTSIKTNSGKTAIYFAEKFNNKEIVELL